MFGASALFVLAAAGAAIIAPVVAGSSIKVIKQWDFNKDGDLEGWMPNAQIVSPRVADGHLQFRAVGGDPQILSSVFGPVGANNRQAVEIKLRCDDTGSGQLFFTNTTEEPYSGLRPHWVVPIRITRTAEQVVRVDPFWAQLGRIIRIRFDPPSAIKYEVDWIRIVEETARVGSTPAWDFSRQDVEGWHAVGGTKSLAVAEGALTVEADQPGAVILTPLADTLAAEHATLEMQFETRVPETLALYWATTDHVGLQAAAIGAVAGGRGGSVTIDLRQFADWSGTITHLGLGFGSAPGDRLAIRRVRLAGADPKATLLQVRYFGPRRAINRPKQETPIELWLVNRGTRAVPAGKARLTAPEAAHVAEPEVKHAAIAPDKTAELVWTVRADREGAYPIRAELAGQTFQTQLRIDPPVDVRPAKYVPTPKPIKTTHEIGVFYFPGWSPDQWSRWAKQEGFPERDPVLGFYREGDPAVADWHIKWAVENGITFFIYDWYWRDGNIDLERGLHEGYLRARYRNLLKFCVMWANHEPFADHTLDQLITVADYWIARYFRRPDYYTVEGRPFVMFFIANKLADCLGSAEKVREALKAMRARTEQAGLKPIYFAGCGDVGRQSQAQLKAMGFDALSAYNYPSAGAMTKHSPYELLITGHREIWERAHSAGVVPYIPTLTVGWDSRPWHASAALVRFGRTTAKLESGLRALKQFLAKTGKRIGILEAWNEWGEGSYIEPNVQFGFGDLEAIRRVFGVGSGWPANIAPSDVRLGGYEIAPPEQREAKTGLVRTAGVHPDVLKGLQIECEARKLTIHAGAIRLAGKPVQVKQTTLAVKPADTVAIDNRPTRLVGGAISKWKGGNRLTDEQGDRLLPGSLAGYSLLIRSGTDRFATVFEDGRDYRLDGRWGAFEVAAGGGLKPSQEVAASYVYGLRRIDAIQISPDGTVSLRRGQPSPDCPLPAEVDEGCVRLANLYRPYHSRTVEPDHVYVIAEWPSAERAPGDQHLSRLVPRTLRKLRAGERVTIICWGDSVTVGGDASRPELRYVDRFGAALRSRFPRVTVRLVNAGVGGSNSSQRLPGLKEEVLDHRPDLITAEFVNDMGFTPEMIQKNYGEFVSRARKAGAEVILVTPHFTMPEWMGHERSRGRDSRPACEALRRVAGDLNVALADVAKRWERLERQGLPYETLLKNGINHPDDRGHLVFVEELMRFFPAGK